MISDPPWLTIARRDIGLEETPGKDTTPKIRRWLIELGAWWRDDEAAWCGVSMAAWMHEAGAAIPKHYYRARAWLDWGTALTQPALGCVVVFERRGGGHVGLIVGQNELGYLLVLGGNQGNRVSIASFSPDRVLGYRWPLLDVATLQEALPTLSAFLPLSTNEA
jgi:uncharacterized protein (TIGR02594 family)